MVLVTLLTAAGFQLASSTAARADGAYECTFGMHVTSKLVINGSNRLYMAPNGDCTYAENWYVNGHLINSHGSRVSGSSYTFSGCTGDGYNQYDGNCWDFDSFSDYPDDPSTHVNIKTPGKFTAIASSGIAEDEDCNYDNCDAWYDINYRTGNTVVAKYGTQVKLSILPKLKGRRTFKVSPTHYSPANRRFVGSTHTAVLLERYSHREWVVVKRINTGSHTSRAYTKKIGKARYRAVVQATSTRWGSVSKSVNK